jgi:ATP-binding cassette subfamily B protein
LREGDETPVDGHHHRVHAFAITVPNPSRQFVQLRPLVGFLRPYRMRLAGAALALVVSSLTVLLLGQGLRHIVDQGLRAGDASLLDGAVGGFVADLRDAAFRRVISQSPAYFETTKTGEVLSRLTNDTELLQTVIGSSPSLAVRNTARTNEMPSWYA